MPGDGHSRAKPFHYSGDEIGVAQTRIYNQPLYVHGTRNLDDQI